MYQWIECNLRMVIEWGYFSDDTIVVMAKLNSTAKYNILVHAISIHVRIQKQSVQQTIYVLLLYAVQTLMLRHLESPP
jgi:hypothetical protein